MEKCIATEIIAAMSPARRIEYKFMLRNFTRRYRLALEADDFGGGRPELKYFNTPADTVITVSRRYKNPTAVRTSFGFLR